MSDEEAMALAASIGAYDCIGVDADGNRYLRTFTGDTSEEARARTRDAIVEAAERARSQGT